MNHPAAELALIWADSMLGERIDLLEDDIFYAELDDDQRKVLVKASDHLAGAAKEFHNLAKMLNNQ